MFEFIFIDIGFSQLYCLIYYCKKISIRIRYILIILRISIMELYVIYPVFNSIMIIILDFRSLRWAIIYYVYLLVWNLLFMFVYNPLPIFLVNRFEISNLLQLESGHKAGRLNLCTFVKIIEGNKTICKTRPL